MSFLLLLNISLAFTSLSWHSLFYDDTSIMYAVLSLFLDIDYRLSLLSWFAIFISFLILVVFPRSSAIRTFVFAVIVRLFFLFGLKATLLLLGVVNVSFFKLNRRLFYYLVWIYKTLIYSPYCRIEIWLGDKVQVLPLKAFLFWWLSIIKTLELLPRHWPRLRFLRQCFHGL